MTNRFRSHLIVEAFVGATLGIVVGLYASAASIAGGGVRTQAGEDLAQLNATLSAPIPNTWSTAKDWTSATVKAADIGGKVAEATGGVAIGYAATAAATTAALAVPTGGGAVFLGGPTAVGAASFGATSMVLGRGLQVVSKAVGPFAEAAVGIPANREGNARYAQSELQDRVVQIWKDAGLDAASCRRGVIAAQVCMDALNQETRDVAQSAQAFIDRATNADWTLDSSDQAYLKNQAAGEAVKFAIDKAASGILETNVGLEERGAKVVVDFSNKVLRVDRSIDKEVEDDNKLTRSEELEPRKMVLKVSPRRATSVPTAVGSPTEVGGAEAPARRPPSPDCAILADTAASRALMARDAAAWGALMVKCGK